MGQELQRQNQGTTIAISNENWQQNWELTKVSSDATALTVVAAGGAALSQMGKNANGGMLGVTIWKAAIMEVVEFCAWNWNANQIRQAAEMEYEDCYCVTLPELKLFTRRLSRGVYTSNKNISPAIFLEFLADYTKEIIFEREEFIGMGKIKPVYQWSNDDGEWHEVLYPHCEWHAPEHLLRESEEKVQAAFRTMLETIAKARQDAENKANAAKMSNHTVNRRDPLKEAEIEAKRMQQNAEWNAANLPGFDTANI